MRRAGRAWTAFWFTPTPTSALGVLRIAFGLLMFAWTVTLTPDLSPFFTLGGLFGGHVQGVGVWGVLDVLPTGWAVLALYASLLTASLALAIGWGTRVAAAIIFVGLVSLERRDPWVFNTGDTLLRVTAFYLMLAPAGAALSLDRRRRHPDAFWDFPSRAPWAIRLMQIQLSVIYIAGVWDKVQGTSWNNGTALSFAMRLTDLASLPTPALLSHSPVVVNLLTYGTLATELSLGVLVWNRRLRPWVLLIGVVFHLSIAWSIRVGFFSLAMFILYLSFLSPDWAAQKILGARDTLARRRAAPSRHPAGASSP